jgi:nucleotide-binding universal stress UspA family protein
MGFKTIIVGLNDVQRNQALLDAGIKLARKFDAHILGLYVIPAVQIYSSGFESMPVVFEGRRDFFQSSSSSVRSSFEGVLSREGIRGEFQLVDSASAHISNTMIERARAADLVLLSQADSTRESMIDEDLVERVALAAGRPTLSIPRQGEFQFPELAIVGWNGTRESARAAFDSIPLLKQSKEVHIVWVNPQRDLPPGEVPGADLAEVLSRHGVKAVAEPLPSELEAGEALSRKVKDSGAELLVMGAYGHARLREFILGGATRSVLSSMECPVLFSH